VDAGLGEHVDDPVSVQLLHRSEMWRCPCGHKSLHLCSFEHIVVYRLLMLEALIEENHPG
jgi:hypothetical protein